jgi:hypothetical protein
MNILLQLWRRLSLLCQGRYEREMEEEIRVHLAMPIKQNLSSGMAVEEARHGNYRRLDWWRFGWRTDES